MADLIAAGEVVERPASVIKELVENSLDAGAKNIIIEIRNGGATYIRVTDDGCGMTPDDLGISFIRHATSKLHDEAGLEAISTMGFRGEALAAISSVSRMEIISRAAGTNDGTRLTLNAGEIEDMSPFGCPQGTTVIVTDLFFNTPARLKFLKSDRSESSACSAAALHCALSRPDVSFRLIKDGEDEFLSPGDGKIDSALYSLLGRSEAASMLPCSAEYGGLSISGCVSSPAQGRGNRSRQFFFVNGRYIKSILLQTALEQAYRNTLLTGRYPSCVLYLNLSYGSVDVNVHPTKMEIRFGSEKTVFDFVYNAVRLALEEENRSCLHDSADAPPAPVQYPAPAKPTPSELRSPIPAYALKEPPEPDAEPLTIPGFSSPIQEAAVYPAENTSQESFSIPSSATFPGSTSRASQPSQPPPPEYNIIGEAFNAYIILEKNDELLLIDKHAAHERIIFNRLKSQERENTSQYLLTPATLSLSSEDSELLEANGELLGSLGFEIESFGKNEYIVRSVPADMFTADVVPAIEEILERIRTCNAPDPASVSDEILHTVACKAAIKAGWHTHRAEEEQLVRAVLSGEIKYCPHGRPVSVTVSRRELDKLFKRIV